MLWICEPVGMLRSGNALPMRIGDFGSGNDRVADIQSERRQHVALLAIRIEQERDAGRAVRVVFDRGDPGRNRRTCSA